MLHKCLVFVSWTDCKLLQSKNSIFILRLWSPAGPGNRAVIREYQTNERKSGLRRQLCTTIFLRQESCTAQATLKLVFCFCFFSLKQSFSVEPWLSWVWLCTPGCPRIRRLTGLCLLSAGIKGLYQHCQIQTWYVTEAGLNSWSCLHHLSAENDTHVLPHLAQKMLKILKKRLRNDVYIYLGARMNRLEMYIHT